MIVVTDEQGFRIINRRNALENPYNHSGSLTKLIQKAPDKVIRVFKGDLRILVADEQGFALIRVGTSLKTHIITRVALQN